MNPLRKAAAAAALAFTLVSGPGRAAGMISDPTGLWFDPAQPGWGLEVAQQGETAFAVIFTYDASHKPVWYVASNMAASTTDFPEIPPAANGTLYRTTGPAFSAATFDPHGVAVTPVGTLQISYTNIVSRILSVTYTIDGVQVSKILQPQTWSANAQDLIGQYSGGLTTLGPADSRCPAAPVPLPAPPQPASFSVSAGSAPDHVNIAWGTGIDTACTVDASYSRQGVLATLTGPLACGPIGNPTSVIGTLTVSEITANAAGFSGNARVDLPQPSSCGYVETFGGVLSQASARSGMNPDPTGVWFRPDESGWGVILTQQGANIFAALFVYGADGKPAWWVASNVVDTGAPVNLLVGEAFSGTLYSATGPYLGAPDQAAFSATAVGTLRIAYVGGTDLISLAYTVDGVTVNKTVQRETWSSNAAFLSGTFTGGLFPLESACGNTGIFAPAPVAFTATPGSGSGVQLSWTDASAGACLLDATYTQAGQLATLAGPVQCGSAATPAGLVTISSASMSDTGFAGFTHFTGANCTSAGFVGGVKRLYQ
jgi:hypothetical protein